MKAVLGRAAALPLAPLLLWQGRRVRRVTPRLPEATGPRAGRRPGQGAPLRLLVVGDSSAAGVGVTRSSQALIGQLLDQLAAQTARPLVWRVVARTGVTTEEARALLEASPAEPFDVAVVALGVNDVTALHPARRWRAAVARLQTTLIQRHQVKAVLWSGLPPMHRFPALPQPLRAVLGLHARGLDQELAHFCRSAGKGAVRTMHVSMPDLQAQGFIAADGFHPGRAAYRLWAQTLAPVVLAQAG